MFVYYAGFLPGPASVLSTQSMPRNPCPALQPQVSFAWSGFNNAMISNVGMVLRNIYSKKFLGQLKVRSSLAGVCWHFVARRSRWYAAVHCILHFVECSDGACIWFCQPRAAQAVLHTAAVPPPLRGMAPAALFAPHAQRRCHCCGTPAACALSSLPCPTVYVLQLDGINLFAILSIISIFYCLPCALVLEGAVGGDASHGGGGTGRRLCESACRCTHYACPSMLRILPGPCLRLPPLPRCRVQGRREPVGAHVGCR